MHSVSAPYYLCKKNKRALQKKERESTTRKPWASPAVAASVAYAPPTRVLAR